MKDDNIREICTVNHHSFSCIWVDVSINRSRLVSVVDGLKVLGVRRKEFNILLLCIGYKGEET